MSYFEIFSRLEGENVNKKGKRPLRSEEVCGLFHLDEKHYMRDEYVMNEGEKSHMGNTIAHGDCSRIFLFCKDFLNFFQLFSSKYFTNGSFYVYCKS